CVSQPAAGLAIRPDAGGTPKLSFRFPDADALFAQMGDPNRAAGPAAIALTQITDPLPCGLATAGATCATQVGLVACIDDLYTGDGTCQTAPAATFTPFTPLPPPNAFQADCFSANPPCNASATSLSAAIDADGNILVPFNWQGVLLSQLGVPVPRLVRATIQPPMPFTIPDQVFLGSFTPEGLPLPPVFVPQTDANQAPGTIALFGSVDAGYTVLRVARRSGLCQSGPRDELRCSVDADCAPGGTCNTVCVGGSNPDTPCTTNADCTGGACGELYPDFGLLTEGGPLVLRGTGDSGFCQLPPHAACTSAPDDCPSNLDGCFDYALEAQTPVALESLTSGTADLFAFTALEAVDTIDRNGDMDDF